MKKTDLLRSAVLSLVPIACASMLASVAAPVHYVQRRFARPHVQSVVLDGSTRAGWYSFPGQSPKLRFKGNQVQITSRDHSTVLLSRGSEITGSAAEVSLMRSPISTSSISGLAVLSDARHAMVIGLDGGSVVLWQLEPAGARVVARHRVNPNSALEFRVTGGTPANVRFFWRHQNDGPWHMLGDSASDGILNYWHQPLTFGLLLDGPQGSEATFSNYRSAVPDIARNVPQGSATAAMAAAGE